MVHVEVTYFILLHLFYCILIFVLFIKVLAFHSSSSGNKMKMKTSLKSLWDTRSHIDFKFWRGFLQMLHEALIVYEKSGLEYLLMR